VNVEMCVGSYVRLIPVLGNKSALIAYTLQAYLA